MKNSNMPNQAAPAERLSGATVGAGAARAAAAVLALLALVPLLQGCAPTMILLGQ